VARPFALPHPDSLSPRPLRPCSGRIIPADVGILRLEHLDLSGWGYADFHAVVNFAITEFSEVRLTAYYWGTTATASISTKKSGCARPDTNAMVIAGGLGVSGQAF
jgi:hypothetical protein